MSEIIKHTEYNSSNNPYPSFGKRYCGEPAVISLTSWKARINTVSKTLFSLLKQCPGFHIVLVLSEEEFPKMMDELPDNLKLFVDNEHIEVLWVYKNYKAFKKILWTMDKYRNVPVISADDDFIYINNFAEILYNDWKLNKKSIYAIGTNKIKNISIAAGGGGVIYPPYCFNHFGIKFLTDIILKSNHDDMYYAILANILKIKIIKSQNKYKNRNERYIDLPTSKTGLGYTNSYNDNILPSMYKTIMSEYKNEYNI